MRYRDHDPQEQEKILSLANSQEFPDRKAIMDALYDNNPRVKRLGEILSYNLGDYLLLKDLYNAYVSFQQRCW